MGWIVVQFYKFEFVLNQQKLQSLLVEKRARTTTTREIAQLDTKFGVVDGGAMAKLISRIKCD